MNMRLALLLGAHLLLLPAVTATGWPARAAALAWLACQAIILTALLRPRSSLLGPNTWRGQPRPCIALTFDDGPHPTDTPALLEALARENARATFFVIGARARAAPDSVLRIVRAGHELGAHSDTHPWWFSFAGPDRTRREVSGVVTTLTELTGHAPRWFRPPMGHKSLFLATALLEAGLRQITWTRRTYDTVLTLDADAVQALVLRAQPGDILLLHESGRRGQGPESAVVAAIPALVRGLRARALEPVSLTDLLAPVPTAADPPPSRAPLNAGGRR